MKSPPLPLPLFCAFRVFCISHSLLAILYSLFAIPTLPAQTYIGFVYPAGGQQGTTFRCTLGGQSLDGVCGVTVTGDGVTGRIAEYNKKMNPQEVQLLNEQLRELRALPAPQQDTATSNLITRIDKLVKEHVQQPQCDSIANLAIAEITIAGDATSGQREIRLFTPRGVSNPMPFHVGQLPETAAPSLPTSTKQILGKEAQSLRRLKRDPATGSDLDDDEIRVTLPCTVNGQIASGTVDRYRFAARRGQRLVITTHARTLVPYLADAVPGWFQPVITLRDAQGREVAYNDDYRFKPDPVILFDVPQDGDYLLAIHDAIFRGREDFVYRCTLGELPFVTGIFPLGGQADVPAIVQAQGVNLAFTRLAPPTENRAPGLHPFTVYGKDGLLSDPVPFAIDTLPDGFESEPNDTPKTAQRVDLPLIINGTIGTSGDRDLFQFMGRAGQELVAEVHARRLDSPLDATLTLTSPGRTRIAFSDDQEETGAGINTHHADPFIHVTLPTNGLYTLTLADAQQKGGEAYAYRLRISPPRPDFELFVVPSRVAMPSNGTAAVTLHAVRKEGFTGPIRFRIKEPADGFTLTDATLTGTQTVARLSVKTTLGSTPAPVPLLIQGLSQHNGAPLIHNAIPAEDRMQAFFWRHLVPAQDFRALVHEK